MPADWRERPPFAYAMQDVSLRARTADAADVAVMVRYGYLGAGTSQCTNPWSAAGDLGRVCVTTTPALYYGGWAVTGLDHCGEGQQGCAATRHFSIAVR